MYPNFNRFLELHNLKRTGDVIENDMTFSVSGDGGAFEWAGDSLRNLLCKPSTIFDLRMWRMVFDIARFNASAVRVLSEDGNPTLGEYLKREGYSPQFGDKFLIVWTLSHPRSCDRFESFVDRL
jgi:predicted NAD/FAD-binding protein